MKQNRKEAITFYISMIGCILGNLIGYHIGGLLGGWFGGLFLMGILYLITSIIIKVFFPPKMFDGVRSCYRIMNNKLYYNINCNGIVEPLFITDVDEDNEEFTIINSNTNYFPAVMVKGRLKLFILKDTMEVEGDYNFYTINELRVEEILLERCEAQLLDSSLRITLNEELKPEKQHMITKLRIIGYGIDMILKEQVALDTVAKAGYKSQLSNQKSYVYDSLDEAYEAAKRAMIEE